MDFHSYNGKDESPEPNNNIYAGCHNDGIPDNYQEVSLDASETLEINNNLYGAQLVNNPSDDMPRPPFIVSNRKLGGFPLDPAFRTSQPSDTLRDTHPRKRFVPSNILVGVYQLQTFLQHANDVITNSAPVRGESMQYKLNQARQRLNKLMNNCTLVTSLMEDLNSKASALVRAASASEYVHNNIQDVTAYPGLLTAFDGHMTFLRKLAEDMKTEYVLFTKNFNVMTCSVREQVMNTLTHVHNSVVALYGRMESVSCLVKQLELKHELLKGKRAWKGI